MVETWAEAVALGRLLMWKMMGCIPNAAHRSSHAPFVTNNFPSPVSGGSPRGSSLTFMPVLPDPKRVK